MKKMQPISAQYLVRITAFMIMAQRSWSRRTKTTWIRRALSEQLAKSCAVVTRQSIQLLTMSDMTFALWRTKLAKRSTRFVSINAALHPPHPHAHATIPRQQSVGFYFHHHMPFIAKNMQFVANPFFL